MFIIYGEDRINLSLIKRYKPDSKINSGKTHYIIKLIYLDKTIDEIHFFEDKESRDKFLAKLDKNIIK